MKTMLFAVAVASLFSCNQNNGQQETENKFAGTDKIVFSYKAGEYTGALEYTVTATPEEIRLKLEALSYDEVIKKTYPFTQAKWNKLVASFNDLSIKGKAANNCDGGESERLTFYEDGEKIKSAHDYHCGKGSRNFSGAKLDLSYLVKNFDELTASLQEKGDPGDEPDSDDEYKWTSAEREKYLKECHKSTEALESERGAKFYCNCMVGNLQIGFATREDADRQMAEVTKMWKAKCSDK